MNSSVVNSSMLNPCSEFAPVSEKKTHDESQETLKIHCITNDNTGAISPQNTSFSKLLTYLVMVLYTVLSETNMLWILLHCRLGPHHHWAFYYMERRKQKKNRTCLISVNMICDQLKMSSSCLLTNVQYFVEDDLNLIFKLMNRCCEWCRSIKLFSIDAYGILFLHLPFLLFPLVSFIVRLLFFNFHCDENNALDRTYFWAEWQRYRWCCIKSILIVFAAYSNLVWFCWLHAAVLCFSLFWWDVRWIRIGNESLQNECMANIGVIPYWWWKCWQCK